MFLCFCCEKRFALKKDLIKHIKLFHNEKWQCGQLNCGRIFNNSSEFSRHLNKHDNENGTLFSNSSDQKTQLPSVSLSNNSINQFIPELNLNTSVLEAENFNNYEDNNANDIDDVINDLLITFILSISIKSNINRKSTLEILKHVETLFVSVLNAMNLTDIATKITKHISELQSESKIIKHLSKKGKFIHPQQFKIHSKVDKVQKKHKITYAKKDINATIVPLRFYLKKFFELPDVYNKTINYMNSLNSTKFCNFIQGNLWQGKMKKFVNQEVVIPFHLYVDDWEPDNALGAHKKSNSIAGSYIMLPTIPPEYYSLLENILVVQLFKSTDKSYSDSQIYINLIKECVYLETYGIDLLINGKTIKVYFMLGLIIGDNLGLHEILGFATSFRANYNCIFCKTHRNEMETMSKEDPLTLRNLEGYEKDVFSIDTSLSGLKTESVFNKVPSFHVTTNYSVDIMHDMFEGTCHYDLAPVLNYFINTKKYFSLETLNERKSLFNYGVTDIGNISIPITLSNIENEKFTMSASEMKCFIHFAPLIIGDLVPLSDPVWIFFLKLVQIIDILLSKSFTVDKINLLESIIKQHHEFYVNFFELKLKPKHHLMLHYPRIIRHSGPPINFWSMRGEGKHKELKSYAKNITSRVNLPYSIMIKLQFKFSSRVHAQRGLIDAYDVGTLLKNNYSILAELQLKLPSIPSMSESYKVVNWLKINGIFYRYGLIFNISKDPNISKLVKIKYCISTKDNKSILFIVDQIQIEKFVSHYQAFKISDNVPEKLSVLTEKEFVSHPVEKHMVKGEFFVRLKEL